MGENGLVERTIAGMSARNPESFRQAMWSDEWLALGMKAFQARLAAEKRDAVRLYFEALGAVSTARDAAIIALLAALELRDMTQLHAYVALARQSEGADGTDAYRLAKQLVRERIMSDPAERRACMQEIFGVMDATPPVGGPPPGDVRRSLTVRGDDPDPAGGWKRKNGNGAHA